MFRFYTTLRPWLDGLTSKTQVGRAPSPGAGIGWVFLNGAVPRKDGAMKRVLTSGLTVLRKLEVVVIALAATAGTSVIFMLLASAAGMVLWNYAVTSVFGLPPITLWQAFALNLLAWLVKNS